jgi:hypothetical protein
VSDFLIKSLRGGLNNCDPAISLPDDQCLIANNVEWVRSTLGERRKGCTGVTLPASISGKDRVTFLHRHLPTSDETAAELWALGLTGTSSSQLSYKDTTWHDVTLNDAATLTGFSPYQWVASSIHGKIFIAYDSAVDRLHCRDAGSTTLRRCGLAEPVAPTGANTAAGGTFTGTRYYRVRYTVQVAGVTTIRSEPSPALTFAPSGIKTGVTVTKPASISENETHWELEASLDNANFYVIATTVVGTTTFDDTTNVATGYAQTYPLSEPIGAYSLQPSYKYLCIDADRLMGGSSWEDASKGSQVSWSPVTNAEGVGNDERLDLTTDPTIDLDSYEGGALTGLVAGNSGSVFAFKMGHIYKLVRTGNPLQAYDVVTITKERGALPGSVVSGMDQNGAPCIYFLDPQVGPCRYGNGGLQWLGADIWDGTWTDATLGVNLNAAKAVCSALYDPRKRQVQWSYSKIGSDRPNQGLIIQTDLTKPGESGAHGGISLWDGIRIEAFASCLFADNIDAGTARNLNLRPFVGVEGHNLLQRCDTGNTDDAASSATTYTARIVTKPYQLTNMLNQFGVMAAYLMAAATSGAELTLNLYKDFSTSVSKAVAAISFTPAASEAVVMKQMDNLSVAELRVAQFEFIDSAPATTDRWELHQFAVKQTGGQTS